MRVTLAFNGLSKRDDHGQKKIFFTLAKKKTSNYLEVVLASLQNSLENTCAESLFELKLEA